MNPKSKAPMRPVYHFAMSCAVFFTVCLSGGLSPLAGADYDLSAASYLGGANTDDSVRAAVIQSDGTVVLAANIGLARPGGLTPTVLGTASTASGGALVRLASDGKTVLGVTLVGALVTDLACDGNDRLYVGLGTEGIIALDASAATVRWSKTPANTVLRLDVGAAGTCAALATSTADPRAADPGSGTIWVYDANGTALGNFIGHHNTLDLAVDDTTATVALIGWRQANDSTKGGPVQISYMRGHSFSGTVKWTGYDWSTDPTSANYLNKPNNNMADSRGCRISMGRDGKLYGLFEVAGGNHIFRYSPLSVMTAVTLAGGDQWNQFYNTRSQAKTFVARYEPATGAYLRGVQFCTRLTAGGGNSANPQGAEVCADEQGRVYFGGEAAYGLPIPTRYKPSPLSGQIVFAPPSLGTYFGGAFLVVMNPDMSKRLYCTALSNTAASTRAIAARAVAGQTVIAFGGETGGATYTVAPIQATAGAVSDGWFAVTSSGTSERPTQPANATVTAPATATFAVRASGPAPTYQWESAPVGSTTFAAISGATSASYTTGATSTAMSGSKYCCVVKISWGSETPVSETSTAAVLTVTTTTTETAPAITTQPSNSTVTAPATATFTVAASGSPNPTYQWQSAPSGSSTFTAISGATSASYITGATSTAMSGVKYRCVATNSAGSATSNAATLTVTTAAVAPAITSQPSNATVAAPTTVTFTVVASGSPNPTYQWQSAPSGSSTFTAISGATSASYTTGATSTGMSGSTYRCVATNSADSATSNAATLTVNAAAVAPAITTQPSNATVTAPTTATFTVVASGSPNPTYQWQSAPSGSSTFTAISGATSASYITGATSTAMSGVKYRCVATNSAGSATSNAATLTVTAWSTADIGAVAAAGSSALSSGIWTLKGSGADIWGTSDEFRFTSQPVSGDVIITARVTGLQKTNAWAKAGVMVRETVGATSRHAFTCLTGSNGPAFQRRLSTAGSSIHTGGPALSVPGWVRLERVGNLFISSESSNGTTWTEIRRETIAMSAAAQVGLAVTSHADGTLCTATFSNVTVVSASAAAN